MKPLLSLVWFAVVIPAVLSEDHRELQQAAITFEVVTAARNCHKNATDPRQVDCDFRVGRSLRFTIAGVGTPDPGIAFLKSDIDGDYYGAFGLQHGCVIVWSGATTTKKSPARAADVAFVSPANGQVYRDWTACRTAKTQ